MDVGNFVLGLELVFLVRVAVTGWVGFRVLRLMHEANKAHIERASAEANRRILAGQPFSDALEPWDKFEWPYDYDEVSFWRLLFDLRVWRVRDAYPDLAR